MFVGCPPVAAEQSFVVPRGVRSVRVVAVGARGGRGGAAHAGNPGFGGPGAVATADLFVSPGMTLYVWVGGVGGSYPAGAVGQLSGGFNGGAPGGAAVGSTASTGSGANSGGGGGGGASDVRTCSVSDRRCDTLASRLLVAGGGGGGGGGNYFNDFSLGGVGGAAGTDADGGDGAPPYLGTGGGKGATRAAGGSAGGEGAAAGAIGAGGHGASASPPAPFQPGAGGGGGGGLYGGGGGAAGGDVQSAGAGAGGGSSFGPSGATFRTARPLYAPSEIAASVTISYAAPLAARAPLVTITRPRAGQVIHRFVGTGNNRKRRQLVVAGRAKDPSGVRGVALSIERLPRRTASAGARRCRWLHHTRGLVRARCDRPPPLTAKLRAGGSWTYRVPRRIKLPAGRYRVSAFGKNNAGTFGNAAPRRSRVIAFRLSKR